MGPSYPGPQAKALSPDRTCVRGAWRWRLAVEVGGGGGAHPVAMGRRAGPHPGASAAQNSPPSSVVGLFPPAWNSRIESRALRSSTSAP